MSLSLKEIHHLATLAKVQLSPDHAKLLEQDLNSTFTMIEKINSVNTEGLDPMSHPLDLTQRYRPDQITEHNQREQLQQNAPAVESGLYLVPQVIDNE